MNVTVTNGLNLGWLSYQYAYPFSFPFGQQSGTYKAGDQMPLTWGDLLIYPPQIIPTVMLPVIALMIVWKGLN